MSIILILGPIKIKIACFFKSWNLLNFKMGNNQKNKKMILFEILFLLVGLVINR